MELHALAQLEFPGQVVDRLPRRRQPRRQTLLFILFDEAREDVRCQRVVRRQVVIVRIDRGRLGAGTDGQRFGICRQRHAEERGHRRENSNLTNSHVKVSLVGRRGHGSLRSLPPGGEKS
jgi:hypothetical protein